MLLTDAIVTLVKNRKELNTIVNATPEDTIANAFGKPIENILQGLGFGCVSTADESSNESWNGLRHENDLPDIPQTDSINLLELSILFGQHFIIVCFFIFVQRESSET